MQNLIEMLLKNGYKEEDVRAIAGYVLAKSGRRYLVVCLVNHPEAGRAREMLNHLLRWTYANG